MTRINVKIKAGTETELNGAGPSIPESAMQQLEAQLDTLQPDDILVLAGSIPKSLSQSTYERLLAGWRATACGPWWMPPRICWSTSSPITPS